MVAHGALGKYTPKKPSTTQFRALVAAMILYSLGAGFMAGTQPTGAGWRLFSWHPFLTTLGMVGCMGSGAMVKKLGGYENTKMHGILANLGLVVSGIGIYCIYVNKNNNGYSHLKTNHSLAGAAMWLSCLGLGLVGGVVLHPDFGMDKTNKTIRFAHKTSARLVLMFTWFTAFMGLIQLTDDMVLWAVYGLPLTAFVPFVLL